MKVLCLPLEEAFYHKLMDSNISNEDYAHAKNTWETFDCKTLGDYHDPYNKTGVLLLADIFLKLEKYAQSSINYIQCITIRPEDYLGM